MQVQKRDGRVVDFDQKRIYNAIVKAMVETVGGADYMLASIISQAIEKKFSNKINVTTDEIHDAVENALMDSPRKDAAKSYILYRDARKRQQDDEPKYKLLSKEFLSKYKHLENPMSELGSFVYYRTYSRYLPDKKRREYWWETVARAVDYNCSLQVSTTREEAEELFDNMFNLRQFLAGRTLWSGGTKTAYSNPISQYNCSGIALDNFDAYKDICYLLMLGVGVGFSAERKHVEKLPKVRSNVQIIHQSYEPFQDKKMRKESTEFNITGNVIEIIVGDSKLGWANVIDILIKVFYSIDFDYINFIVINYNSVRPHGEKLKTFGGTASGHEALKTILEKIVKVLLKENKSYKKLRPIEAMDIANIIAEGIVVGGVRRSAEMCFMDSDDDEIMNAKRDLYTQDSTGNWIVNSDILHRMMSNNSVAYYKRPTLDDLKRRFEIIRHSAEGNFYNMEAAAKRKSNIKISNPCGEILLDSHQFCNLTTVNMMAFVEDGKLNLNGLLKAQELSARAGYRIATMELELPKWNEMQARDRLIGTSFTGWFDMVNATNMSKEDQKELAKLMRAAAQNAAYDYADKLGLNRPELVTSVKPEGTLSQLPTVSSGLHFSHSPYYVRRVRINSADPLVKVCEELGYPIFPEVGQEMETARTKVIEFPVKAPVGKTKYDVSAIEQLEIYKMFMENYVDHNASNTISVKDNEWDDVIQWVYNNWDSVIGITFMSLNDSFYSLLPYEAITEEEYNERKSKMKPFVPSLITKYEVQGMEEDLELDPSCSTGACPIR